MSIDLADDWQQAAVRVCGPGLKPSPRPEGLQGPDDFWAQVNFCDSLSDCWIWCGKRSEFGHGAYVAFGRTVASHRVSSELAEGPIPYYLVVRHKCDNPPCVRPDHLERGTQEENRADMISRGRAPWQRPKRMGPFETVEDVKSAIGDGLIDIWAEQHGVNAFALRKWFEHPDTMPPRVEAALRFQLGKGHGEVVA